jgi:hypothetical protein
MPEAYVIINIIEMLNFFKRIPVIYNIGVSQEITEAANGRSSIWDKKVSSIITKFFS